MTRIVKATEKEKKEYKGLYPLFGFITVKGKGKWFGDVKCAVEYLGEGKGEPNYEVMAPEGLMFEEGVHTLLCTTQEDLYTRLCGNGLVEEIEDEHLRND